MNFTLTDAELESPWLLVVEPNPTLILGGDFAGGTVALNIKLHGVAESFKDNNGTAITTNGAVTWPLELDAGVRIQAVASGGSGKNIRGVLSNVIEA